MNSILQSQFSSDAATIDGIEKLRQMEKFMLEMPQVDLKTEHVLHGGMYARTLIVPQGILATGVLIKTSTILVIYGNCRLSNGIESIDLEGYNVIPTGFPRKAALLAFSETKVTMFFVTNATTVKEAEEDFTDEVDLLASRKANKEDNFVLIGKLK